MGKTQYYTATTLDGYIADENNSLDWLFQVDRGTGESSHYDRFYAGVGAMALGATTYEWVLEHEQVLDDPAKWHTWYGGTSTWVFTHRSLPAVPGADIRFVQGDVAPVHAAMCAASGDRNIWLVGGGDLAGQFADQGLLDEIIVSVAPVTLGAGAPLLPRRIVGRMTLVGVERDRQFANLTYSVGT
jgi:dihydrofolate reductase